MLRLRQCLKSLHWEANHSDPHDVLWFCRWLGGTYPGDGESPQTEAITFPGQLDIDDDGSLWPTVDSEPTSTWVEDSSVPPEHIVLSEIVWNYMLLHHKLEKSDLLLILGNNDIRVAAHAALLWLGGYADWILFSGQLGNLTKDKWTRPEAEIFRDVALSLGVPADRILIESRATNTGENIRFSYEVLRERNLHPKKIILVQMPFMERRTFATFMRQWPGDTNDLSVSVTSPPISLRNYPNRDTGTLRDVISIMLGCLQRIRIYPENGFQIPQEIPDSVWEAFEQLQASGLYNKFLISSKSTGKDHVPPIAAV